MSAVTTLSFLEERQVTQSSHNEAFLEAMVALDISAITPLQLITAALAQHYALEDSFQLAELALGHFCSLSQLLNASREKVCSATGMSRQAWTTLQLIRKFSGVILREPLTQEVQLTDSGKLFDYLIVTLGGCHRESVRVLYLSTTNKLIEDEAHSTGTLDTTPIYPRQIVRRICELGARAVIIAHNHPSGNPAPSTGDITTTQELADILKVVGCTLHDHVIVGKTDYFSFRREGLIK
jgi:DNA repair protein RadC